MCALSTYPPFMGSPKSQGRTDLYRGMLGWCLGAITEPFDPRSTIDVVLGITRDSHNLFPLLVPGRTSQVSYRELSSKLAAFRWFATADSLLESNRNDLSVAVRTVEAMEPYRGLWTTEGLGYFYASAALQAKTARTSLLAEFSWPDLPARSLLPLHTGMGLAIATHVVARLTGQTHRQKIRDALDRYISLCRENSRPEYANAAMEALGLICKLRPGGLVIPVSRELAQLEPGMLGMFWHGVGRGLYFSPANFCPYSSAVWPSLRLAWSEPPDHQGRLNAVSGFAWAAALVNIRAPATLELLLKRQGHAISDSEDAFAHGVASATNVWHSWSPGTPYSSRLCEYRPRFANTEFSNDWVRHARSQCDGSRFRAMPQGENLQGLFEYQSEGTRPRQ